MATPTIQALYDFETQLETAAQKLLADAGFAVVAAVVYIDPTTQQPQAVPDHSVVATAEVGAADPTSKGFIAGTDDEEEYNIYDFTLKIQLSVPFTAPPTDGGALPDFILKLRQERARIRVLFREQANNLASLLDWLDILTLRPAAVQTRPDQPRAVNVAEIPFVGQFAIKSTALTTAD